MDRYLTRHDPMDVPVVIKELSDLAVDIDFNTDACLEKLKYIMNRMTNYEARRQQDDSGNEDQQTVYCRHFINYGGVEVSKWLPAGILCRTVFLNGLYFNMFYL